MTYTPTADWLSFSERTVKIVETDVSLHGTSTTITVTSTLDNSAADSDNSYTFTIVLTNPCKTATLVTPTVGNISVDDASTATVTFTDLADTYYTDYANPTFCGARTVTVEDSSGNAVSWLSVALTSTLTYTITAAPVSTDTEL